MKYLKKNKKVIITIIIIIITIIRILLSYKLPTFYIKNLNYDDNLYIQQTNTILEGNYLGKYNSKTLVKGPIYSIFLALISISKIPYSMALTIIYVISCSTLAFSLKNYTKNKKLLILIYILLLFNPISYSSDLFQRLYRNSLSISQLLFFLSFTINIINSKNDKTNIINSILLGFTAAIMKLTREDTIWCTVTIIFIISYKLIQKRKIKTLIINTIPIAIIFIILNMISIINYKYYNIYSYNELTNSNFKNAYIKIQQIKTDEKKSNISITRNDLYKLAETSKIFNTTPHEIDVMYLEWQDKDTKEINNGNIIWALRDFIYKNNKFENGKEANKYFKDLANDIDSLFKNKTLEKEFIIPSIFLNTPTIDDIKRIPLNTIKTIKYTTNYENIKSFSYKNIKNIITKEKINNKNYNYVIVEDYHKTENLISKNINLINIIKLFYKFFTIIFSFVSILIIITNKKIIKKKFIVEFIILLIYLLITVGIAYTHTVNFSAIRYFYLGNIYILQTIFIILILDKINLKNIKRKNTSRKN